MIQYTVVGQIQFAERIQPRQTTQIFDKVIGQDECLQSPRRNARRYVRQTVVAQIQFFQIRQPFDRIDTDDLIVTQIQLLQIRCEFHRTIDCLQLIVREIGFDQTVPQKSIGFVAAAMRNDVLNASYTFRANNLLQMSAQPLYADNLFDWNALDFQSSQAAELRYVN